MSGTAGREVAAIATEASRYRATPMQVHQWLAGRLDPTQPGAVIGRAVRLRGRIDVAALAASLDDVVRHHEALRTRFLLGADGLLEALVEPNPTQQLQFRNADIGGTDAVRRLAAERTATDFFSEPFGMDSVGLRLEIAKLGADEHLLLLAAHHAITDGTSWEIILHDLSTAYRARLGGRSPQLPPATPFSQFASLSGTATGPAGEDFTAALRPPWQGRLPGSPGPNGGIVGAGQQQTVEWTVRSGRAAYSQPRATPAIVGMALIGAAVAEFRDLETVTVATPLDLRRLIEPSNQSVVGPLIATIRSELQVRTDEPFHDLISQARAAILRAADTQHPTSPEHPSPEYNSPNMADVLEQVIAEPLALPEFSGVVVEHVPKQMPRTMFDVAVYARLLHRDVRYSLTARPGALNDSELQQLANTITRRTEQLIDGDVTRPVARQHRNHGANTRSATYRLGFVGVREAITAQLETSLEHVAVESGERRVAGADLLLRVSQWANVLRSSGVVAGDHVALAFGHHVDHIAALLATWRLGAAFVPLEAGSPVARTRAIVAHAAPRLLLTQHPEHWLGQPGDDTPLIRTPADADAAAMLDTVPVAPLLADDPAYVIYTSGSTGKPKGVVVGHGAISQFCADVADRYALRADDRVLHVHAPSFDVSLDEILPTLATGATVVIRPDGAVGAGAALMRAAADSRISVLNLPTAWFHELVLATTGDLSSSGPVPKCVRLVVIGGEAARADLVAKFLHDAPPGIRLVNAYGPTEATVYAITADLTAVGCLAQGPVPIGVPLANTHAAVVDESGAPAPEGELLLGGPQVAIGYLRDPERTEQCFLNAPGGMRWYRTGDRVRWLPDGQLSFLGRTDGQVKIAGHRVELGELEYHLRAHPSVSETVVVSVDADTTARLVAFATPRADALLLPDFLRAHLAERVPSYAIPGDVRILPAMPLTASGKLDRSALARLCVERHGVTPPPQPADDSADDLLRMCRLFASVLATEVRADDNFLAMGGTSLGAMRLLQAVENEFGSAPSLGAFLGSPTPRSCVARLANIVPSGAEPSIPAPLTIPVLRSTDRIHIPERVTALGQLGAPVALGLAAGPLMPAQERFLAMDAHSTLRHPAYNLAFARVLTGQLDLAVWRKAVQEIQRRHVALRTVFRPTTTIGAAGFEQVVLPSDAVQLAYTDGETLAGVRQAIVADRVRLFELAIDPPIRISLFRLAVNKHVLSVVVHHVATDEVGLRLLEEELFAALSHDHASRLTDIAPIDIAPIDIALWQLSRLALAHVGTAVGLPAAATAGSWSAGPALPLPTEPGDGCAIRVSSDPVAPLDMWARRLGVSLFAAELAVTAMALRIAAADDDMVVVGVPRTERTFVGSESVVAPLVTTVAVSVAVQLDECLDNIARATQQALAAAVDDQPGGDEDPSPGSVQVLFHQETATATTHHGRLLVQPFVLPRGAVGAKAPLLVGAHHTPTGLRWTVDFDNARVDGAFAHSLARLIGSIAVECQKDNGQALQDVHPADHVITSWLCDGLDGRSRPVPDVSVIERFGEMVNTFPDRIALAADATQLTYTQLAAIAGEFAHRLVCAGLRQADRVAILLPRSIEAVVAHVGVLLAGGVCVPLDPTDPATRIDDVLSDLGVVAFVESGAPDPITGQAFSFRMAGSAMNRASRYTGGGYPLAAEQPLVLYCTSGSTGRPKAVEVAGRSIMNLVVNTDYVRLSEESVIGAAANPAFDAATFEMWGALLNGGCMALLSTATILDPAALESDIAARGITIMFATTALVQVVANTSPATFARLDALLFGGEACNPSAIRRILGSTPPRHLVHVYGPTETTTFATFQVVTEIAPDATAIPIGRPIAGARVYVVDHLGRVVPPGIPGELWVGGQGVAIGYAGLERFGPNPLHPEDRVYRTGDIVRYERDGAITFLGRRDGLVKLRGFRIELAEVERILYGSPSVAAVFVALDNRNPDAARLLAAVVLHDPQHTGTTEVEALIARRLPMHARPNVVVMPSLPLTTNGKVDRHAVLRFVDQGSGGAGAECRPNEPTGIAADVLCIVRCEPGLESVDTDTDLFDAGLSSLRIIGIRAALEARLGRLVPASVFFDGRTARGVAHLLERHFSSETTGRIIRAPQPSLQIPRKETTSTGVFLIPGADGNTTVFDALIGRMSGVNCAVMRPFIDDDAALRRRTVGDLATSMARDIAADLATSPTAQRCCIVGYSLGGMLAFETARQLQQAGHRAPLVLLLDALCPLSVGDRVVRYADRMRTEHPGALLGASVRSRLNTLRQHHTEVQGLPSSPIADLGNRLEQVNDEMIWSYRPRRYTGRVVFVGFGTRRASPSATRWRRHAPALETRWVEGAHGGLASALAEPQVARLAELLCAEIG